jgi:hypothetical protein
VRVAPKRENVVVIRNDAAKRPSNGPEADVVVCKPMHKR